MRGSGEKLLPQFNIMKKHLLILVVILALIGCKKEELTKMNVSYFSKGEESVVSFDSQADSDKMFRLVEDLVAGTDDKLRLLVSDAKIDQIKNEASGIEIKFSELKILHTNEPAAYQVDGLFIPCSGDFAGEDGYSTVFLADQVYLSGPLRNSQGMEIVEQIKELIEQSDK